MKFSETEEVQLYNCAHCMRAAAGVWRKGRFVRLALLSL